MGQTPKNKAKETMGVQSKKGRKTNAKKKIEEYI